jgi:hypothetical protein
VCTVDSDWRARRGVGENLSRVSCRGDRRARNQITAAARRARAWQNDLVLPQRALAILALTWPLVSCGGRIDGDSSASSVATDSNASTNTSGGSPSGPGTHTGGADARSAPPNPTPRAFGAACSSDAECDSSTCFVGGHGGFCSVRCTADAQCPTPSSGAPHCNPHGYCRW